MGRRREATGRPQLTHHPSGSNIHILLYYLIYPTWVPLPPCFGPARLLLPNISVRRERPHTHLATRWRVDRAAHPSALTCGFSVFYADSAVLIAVIRALCHIGNSSIASTTKVSLGAWLTESERVSFRPRRGCSRSENARLRATTTSLGRAGRQECERREPDSPPCVAASSQIPRLRPLEARLTGPGRFPVK